MKRFSKFVKAFALCMTLVLALSNVAFATSPSDGDTLNTDVSYTVAETEWTWSVPAAQTFTDSNLSLTGDVAISPVSGVIALPSGTEISIAIASANAYKLINGVSQIPYQVKKGVNVLGQEDEVLQYVAGSSDNTGVSTTLTFLTTTANIQNATLTGAHNDTLTFTLSVDEA